MSAMFSCQTQGLISLLRQTVFEILKSSFLLSGFSVLAVSCSTCEQHKVSVNEKWEMTNVIPHVTDEKHNVSVIIDLFSCCNCLVDASSVTCPS